MKKLSILLLAGIISMNSCENSNSANTNQEPEVMSEAGPITLVIHGGAGTIRKENMSDEREKAYLEALTEALNTGYSVLEEGGTATESVIATIQVMEESPLFNAGKGAVFTNDGANELDASIMDGKTGMAGSVAGVKTIKSPIAAAYEVMVN